MGLPAAALWFRVANRGLTLALAGSLVLLYLPVVGHAVRVWSLDQELTFGFLVPPFALALLWFRRSSIGEVSPGSRLGLIALLGGLLILVAADRTNVYALAGLSFLPTVMGTLAYLEGMAVARAVFLPVALLTASLSLYRGLLTPLGFTLQQITVYAAVPAARMVGVPVRQSGFHLFVGNLHLVVTQACSGMDSLLALLCLGVAFVGLARGSLPRRVTLMVLIVPIVLVANVIRITLVLMLAQPLGPVAAAGLLHEALSAAIFILATLLLCLACIALRCTPQLDVRRSSWS